MHASSCRKPQKYPQNTTTIPHQPKTNHTLKRTYTHPPPPTIPHLSTDCSYSHLMLPPINNTTHQTNQPIEPKQTLHTKLQPFQPLNLLIHTNNTNLHSRVMEMTTITAPKPHTLIQHNTSPINHKIDVTKQFHQNPDALFYIVIFKFISVYIICNFSHKSIAAPVIINFLTNPNFQIYAPPHGPC